MVLNSKWCSIGRHLFWGICSATAIYTSKSLVINCGFHYPLTIAFRTFLALAVIYILMAIGCKYQKYHVVSNNDYEDVSRQNFDQFGDFFLPSAYWMSMLPASAVAATSLPMLMEGILHMPSLPALVMLFPLVYATESLILYVCESSARNMKETPWYILVVISACGIILYNENRLMVPGLIWGITGLIFIGLARACLVLGSPKAGPAVLLEEANHCFVTMTLAFGTIISGVTAYHFESFHSVWPLSHTTIEAVVLNLATMIGAALSGASVMVFSAFPFDDRRLYAINLTYQKFGLQVSTGSNLLLLLAAVFSNQHPYVHWIQIAAYLVANISIIGIDQTQNFILSCLSHIDNFRHKTPEKKTPPSKYITSYFIAILVLATSYTLSLLSSASITSLSPGPQTTFDNTFHPPSRFDIVISMYDEPQSSITDMITQIKSTTYLQHLSSAKQQPRIIIYTKDPSTNLNNLQRMTGADIVERLDNRGREGGTYLAHIVKKWDALAEQTMFVQAHAHNWRELIPRINDYLVKDTGMLSLGFSGVSCPCGKCWDRWGWEDESGVVPEVFEKVYGIPCRPEQNILLAYKGQFIASARRIRGVKREAYEELLERIAGIGAEKNKMGNEVWEMEMNDGGGSKKREQDDDPSNPRFGFTMERIWGLLMQCATNEKIAKKCPSLLSGMGWGGRVEDCQCLDGRS